MTLHPHVWQERRELVVGRLITEHVKDRKNLTQVGRRIKAQVTTGVRVQHEELPERAGMPACPSLTFPELAAMPEQMAALRCGRVWYSIDHETGVPPSTPSGIRLAYLQVDADEEPEELVLL